MGTLNMLVILSPYYVFKVLVR